MVYLPALRAGFVFDDRAYVVANPMVANGLTREGAAWAFTSRRYASNWHPLTWLSLMADASLFGSDPTGFHAVNLALHLLNVALLLAALTALTGRFLPSLLAAALFALHPLHVESVAWIAERKDVLAGLFWMLALLAYARHARQPSPVRLAAVCVCMAFSLMAKPMAVTLPALLLLLDYWPLGRARSAGWPSLVAEKLPLVALSLASAAMTWSAQSAGHAMRLTTEHPIGARVANAVVSYARYLGKMLWPSGLAVLYPFPREGHGLATVAAAAAILAALTACAVILRREGWPLTGWFWYVIVLFPVAGLVQVGPQAMADRYAYLPFIGLYLAIAWGVVGLAGRSRTGRALVASATLILLAALATITYGQEAYWRDDETLFRRAVAVTTGNWLARVNLGEALAASGRLEAAEREFLEAVAIEPRAENAHYNLGVLCDLRGRRDLAIGHYVAAVAIRPDYAAARANLGVAYLRLGDLGRAEEQLTEALRLDPGDGVARRHLAQLAEERRRRTGGKP